MTGDYFYDSELYHELRELTNKLRKWYGIDKIKWYSVYVWTEDENVFDIYADEIVYYVKDHIIPNEAMPIIQEIQEKLKEIDRYLEGE